MIRVLVADDHLLVRSGLEALLDAADDMTVVGSAADGFQAVLRAREVRPQVVLMDLSMPGMDGVTATRMILAEDPSIQVLVLTSFADREQVTNALDAGAVGYLLKDSEPASLLEAVKAVALGGSPLDPRVARTLLVDRVTPSSRGALTDREREVLGLVAQGMANKQIARALGITEHTVKAHLTSVFQAIGVSDRTSAALWAQRNLPG